MIWWCAYLKQAGKNHLQGTGVDGAKWAGDQTGSAYKIGKQVQCFHDGESAKEEMVGEKWVWQATEIIT